MAHTNIPMLITDHPFGCQGLVPTVFYMDSACSYRTLLGNTIKKHEQGHIHTHTHSYSKCAADRILINFSLQALWFCRFPLFITECESNV